MNGHGFANMNEKEKSLAGRLGAARLSSRLMSDPG
jgi:hypothetical protein